MSRISQKTVQTVKNTVRVSDVFEWLGANVVHRGSSTMAFCPFCEDANSRTPACSLSDELGLFHCFRCNESGDMISAVMKHENVSFPEAVENIAQQFNIPIEYTESCDPEKESRRKHLIKVLEATQDEFLAQRNSKHYTDFLESRGLSSKQADRFELGLSLYSEADKVVQRLRQKFDDESLIEAGICFLDEQSGGLVLRFRNRLMFPIRTAPGTLVGFGARDITGKSKAKYKNSPESDLFKKRNILYGMNIAKRAISKSKRAIVCEGYMDTIALQTHGFEYSVAAMGTALTPYNLSKLATFAQTIYLSLDSDNAGVSAAMRTVDAIPNDFNTEIRVLTIPDVECNTPEDVKKASPHKADEYLYVNVPNDPAYPDGPSHKIKTTFPIMVPIAKDPDEFFNQAKKTSDDFENLLQSAPDLFLFCVQQIALPYITVIDTCVSRNDNDKGKRDADIAVNKQKAKQEIARWISRAYHKMNIYQRQNIAGWMIRELRLMDTFETLDAEWQRAVKSSGRRIVKKDKNIVPVFSSSKSAVEDTLIATLYYHPSSRTIIKQNIDDIMSVFTSETRRKVFTKLDEAYSKGVNAKDVNKEMTTSETEELARIVLANKDNESKELPDDVILQICQNVEKKSLENKIQQEANSPSPDVMKIIELKTRLGKLS